MPKDIERIAVMGAGPGGIAAAAAFSKRGFDVNLFNPRRQENIAAVSDAGGVTIEGELGEGFIPIKQATTDAGEALSDRQLIMCCTPANGQRKLAKLAAPFLKKDAIFLLAPGSAGSLEVFQIFLDQGVDAIDNVILAEAITLPQSARMTGPGQVRIKLPSRVRLAAFPAKNNQRLYEIIGDTIAYYPSPNVLDIGLNNVNFLIHPGPMLLNYAAVERADGYLSLMNEGMTEGVLRLMDALDAERMALTETLGLKPASIDELYIEAGSGPDVYRVKGEPFGMRDRIWDRYIHEDTPYGTVMFSSLGKLLGVPTPIADSINTILGILEDVDFYEEGRTVEKLGIAGLTVEEINHYLHHGTLPS